MIEALEVTRNKLACLDIDLKTPSPLRHQEISGQLRLLADTSRSLILEAIGLIPFVDGHQTLDTLVADNVQLHQCLEGA